MRILLDTHAFLWFFAGDNQLSAVARQLIESREHLKLISLVTVWEMAIKQSSGKLNLPMLAVDYVASKAVFEDFAILPMDLNHLKPISTLPLHHRDPFDRLLVAQALVEEIPILSRDGVLDVYGVERLWV